MTRLLQLLRLLEQFLKWYSQLINDQNQKDLHEKTLNAEALAIEKKDTTELDSLINRW